MTMDISTGKKEFINTFLLVVIYCAGFYGLQFFLYKTGIVAGFPTDKNIVTCDAGWYKTIADSGYSYDPTGQSSAGFYYLFPAIWGISHLGDWGICFLNIFFFATGFSILSGMFKLSASDKILWLSVPTVMFAMVPYAEATFFIFTALCFLGIVKHIRWLIWGSLFFLSLTRATAVCLLPAFLIMELTGNDRRNWLKSLATYAIDYALPILAGLGVFILIQYQQTKVWFTYFIVQQEFWKRKFGWPTFPLENANGFRSTWLTAMAVFVGFISFLLAAKLLVQWLAKDKKTDKLLVLSLGYLTMTLYIILFYNPQWSASTKTYIIGAFRYMLMNPFFYVFLNYFTRNINYKWPHYVAALLLTNIVWLSFASYDHIQHLLYFTANTVMVYLYMLHANKRLQWPAMILVALNIIFQIQMFQEYIASILPD